MAEHSPQRPETGSRRASETAVDTGTQTDDDQVHVQHDRSLTTTRGVDGPLMQRHSAQEAQVARAPDETMAPVHHPHDRGGAPAVRVDMDLDVDINLQAKIKGEIELSIL
jgi:hypothetical protein